MLPSMCIWNLAGRMSLGLAFILSPIIDFNCQITQVLFLCPKALVLVNKICSCLAKSTKVNGSHCLNFFGGT